MSDQASYLRQQLSAENSHYLSQGEAAQDSPGTDEPIPDVSAHGDDPDTENTASRGVRVKPAKRYDQMQRVEGRLTTRQLRNLNNLRITLMSKRNRSGQRITTNSLIRVAIEGFLACQREVSGNDEDELRTSYLQFLEQARDHT